MSLPQFVYGHPRENLLRTAASITVTVGATEASYGTDKLFNGIWADPCKATGVSLTIVMGWTAPVLPALAALLNSNLDVAATLEGNDTDVWTAPAVGPVPFAVPLMNARGFFTSPVLDLSAEAAQAYWRLVISGNARNVVLGELYLGPRRTLDGYLYPGVTRPRQGHSAVHPTHQGVKLAYELAPGLSTFAGAFLAQGGAAVTAVEALIDAARYQARPFVCQPRSDVNDAWMARIAGDLLGVTVRNAETDEVQLPIEMDSRGFPWVEPDDEAS